VSNNGQSKKTFTPQTISAISERAFRENSRKLTVRTTSPMNDRTAAALKSRQNFLKEQCDKIVKKIT
jgi:hypothetical protein